MDLQYALLLSQNLNLLTTWRGHLAATKGDNTKHLIFCVMKLKLLTGFDNFAMASGAKTFHG